MDWSIDKGRTKQFCLIFMQKESIRLYSRQYLIWEWNIDLR